MRILAIAIFLILINAGTVGAQRLVLESKAGFSVLPIVALPLGEREVRKGSFVFPSLLANFEQGIGLELGYSRQVKPWLNVGVKHASLIFSNWQFDPTSAAFDKSQVFMGSFSAPFTIRTVFRERGRFNRLSVHAGFAPGVYVVRVVAPELSYSFSETVRPGASASGSVNYAIRNGLAFSITAVYHQVDVESSMYQEDEMKWYQVGVGIAFRLNRNRNYLRTDYE